MKRKPNPIETPAMLLQRLEWEKEVDWLAVEIEKQAEARVFNETWVDENGETRYDFEVIGTGKSLREWLADVK